MALLIDGVEHVTAEEAAGILNTTRLRVLMLLKEKALVGTLENGTWYISRPSLACAEAHGTDQHVAKGCRTYCSSSGCGCK
jgi:hypothetical protein